MTLWLTLECIKGFVTSAAVTIDINLILTPTQVSAVPFEINKTAYMNETGEPSDLSVDPHVLRNGSSMKGEEVKGG